ncbi:DUF1127 domain-containing protein [Azospirillum sp. sgz302134]
MALSTNTTLSRASTDSSGVIGRAVVTLFDMVATWVERQRQRRALEAMPDHLLHDIGLSRADAESEADKPFWKG